MARCSDCFRLAPVALLALGSMGLNATAAPGDDLPAAETLARRASQAMGTEKAIEAIESMETASTMESPMGAMTSQTYWMKDGRMLVKRTLPGMGEMTIGFDGKVGWSTNPMSAGYTLLDEKGIEELKDQAGMHVRFLYLEETMKEDFKSVKTVERTMFGEKDCYKVRFEQKDEKDLGDGFLYFDAEAALPVGFEMSEPTGQTSVVTFKEWKETGGVKFYRRMVINGNGMEITAEVTSIVLNKIDPVVFAAPEEVKALAAGASKDVGEKTLEDFNPMQRRMIDSMLEKINAENDPAALRAMIQGFESGAGNMPGDFKPAMEYVIAQAEKRLAELGG